MNSIPEPLRSIFKDYCHVEWCEEINELHADVARKDWAYDADEFKVQLRDAIKNLPFTLSDYEKVTNHDFDSEEDLIIWLKQIWGAAFPNEQV